MKNERFLESKYACHIYDTCTEHDYYLTDKYIMSSHLIDQLQSEHEEIERLKMESINLNNRVMKYNGLINQLLKELYLFQIDMYEDYEDYLENDFQKKLELFELEDKHDTEKGDN